MVIAADTRLLFQNDPEGPGYFTSEVLKILTAQYPQHQFHFLFDQPFDKDFTFSNNVTAHIISPQAKNPLLWKWWFDVKVPAVLKKIKADVFLSFDGQCSLRTKVPQCIVVQDMAFLHYPEDYKKSHLAFYKRNTPKFLKNAERIIAYSKFSKKEIVQHYKIEDEKIVVAYPGIKDNFKPLYYDEQTIVKEKFTNGFEYFLYTGDAHSQKNLINLLKAFSVFKRRLQSSMKLVLAGALKNDAFLEALKTYKYRDDVVMIDQTDEETLPGIMASSYAFVFPALHESFGVPVIEAMKCGVPVLTSKASAMEEISEGAALYFDPQNVDDIADKLMMIYKDETRRKSLIEKGLMIAEKYSWEEAAENLWKILTSINN